MYLESLACRPVIFHIEANFIFISDLVMVLRVYAYISFVNARKRKRLFTYIASSTQIPLSWTHAL
jgi:hypothetical protein